jgi:hypothetical protein
VDEVVQPVEWGMQLQVVSGSESSDPLVPLRAAVEQLAWRQQLEELVLPSWVPVQESCALQAWSGWVLTGATT